MKEVELIILASGIATTVTVTVAAACLNKPKLCDGIDKSLYNFLENADNAYTEMYTDKDIYKFTRFATNELCTKLSSIILQDTTKILGTKHCAVRSWSLISKDNNTYRVEKKINPKKLEIRNGLSIDLVDNITELWEVIKAGNRYIVGGIECL